ncbi:MAG: TolC family protein [Desulfobacterales bacterium]
MKGLLSIAIFAMGAVLFGCSTHATLQSELNDYQPPSYFDANVQPQPTKKPLPPSAMVLDAELDREFELLAELKQQWQKTPPTADDPALFYPQGGERWAVLAPLATDPPALRTFLAKGISLPDLEILTLLRHPGVAAAQKNLSAALEGFSQVTQLDEILRQYSAFTEGVMPGVGPMKGRDPIQMKFPYPGVTALKGQVVNQAVKIAQENLAIARRDAVTEARRAYWNLTFVVKGQAITRETLGLFDHLESVATTRYEAGRTSYQDVVKVRIQRATLTENLQTFTEKRRTVAAMMKALLDLPTATAIGNPRDRQPTIASPGLNKLYAAAREYRQELRRLRAKIGKMERMIEMAETMILPSYSSNLSLYPDGAVNQVGGTAMQEPFATTVRADTGAGLPRMPWYGSQDAYLRETRQKLAALGAELRQKEAATDAMVRQAWFQMDQARREVALYRNTIVDLSQTSLDVSTRGYETGGVSFADVIGAYSQWLKTRLALARKTRDLGIAGAALEQVVGASLMVR